MEEKSREERQLIKIEEVGLERMSLEQKQRAEQLYHQLGLDPVINKVLKDFPESLSGFDRVTDKMFGPYDIKGRAETVAKVTALITYAALSEEYHKDVGKLESQITLIEGERDQVRTHYDQLVEKVADVVGGDYEELKANYNELVDRLAEVEHLRSQVATLNKERAQLVEKVAKILGTDYDELKTSYNKLVEKLAEVEHLRTQVATVNREKAELTERYESQIATLENEHNEEVASLGSKISERDSRIEGLESEKIALISELKKLRGDYDQLIVTHKALVKTYNQLKTAITTLAGIIPYEDIREKLGEEVYTFLLKDSRVPDMVIDGVGKFIDFRKYLGLAAEKGAEEASKHAEVTLHDMLTE